MTTVHLQLPFELFLNGLSGLDSAELEVVLNQIARLKVQRRIPIATQREQQLLETIAETLSAEQQTQFDTLLSRCEQEIITQDQLATLIALTDRVEEIHIQRWQALIELAALRQISVDQLIQQLGTTSVPLL